MWPFSPAWTSRKSSCLNGNSSPLFEVISCAPLHFRGCCSHPLFVSRIWDPNLRLSPLDLEGRHILARIYPPLCQGWDGKERQTWEAMCGNPRIWGWNLKPHWKEGSHVTRSWFIYANMCVFLRTCFDDIRTIFLFPKWARTRVRGIGVNFEILAASLFPVSVFLSLLKSFSRLSNRALKNWLQMFKP